MPLLEIKNLRLDFVADGHAARAVDGVSLHIEAGETLCVVGESGCGKSVTAQSIVRLVPSPPARYVGGEILLNGRDTLKMSTSELQAIRGGVVSYVFQEPGASLNPVFRVGAQIKETLKLHQPEKAVEELRWAKERGACGIFKRGFDLDREVTDPYFYPVYEEASALDIPLCIHTGHPLPASEWDRGFPIMYSFTELVSSGVPKKFPKLRFGLIESGASWIPYMISQLGAVKRQSLRGQNTPLPRLFELEPEPHPELFR